MMSIQFSGQINYDESVFILKSSFRKPRKLLFLLIIISS